MRNKLIFIINTYGTVSQIDMAIEECSELQKALLKHRRKPDGNTRKNIIDEIGTDYYKMELSKDFALSFLRLFYHKYSHISDEIFEKFSFSDPYDGNMQECNLMNILSN